MKLERFKELINKNYPRLTSVVQLIEKVFKVKPEKCYLNYNCTEILLFVENNLVVIPILMKGN